MIVLDEVEELMPNEFEETPKGILVSMQEEAFSGYIYTIWYPYSRENVKKIREGGFIAVKNFLSDSEQQKFSILEIISAVPQHYALGSSPRDAEKAFPGFYIEAAKSCRQDWEQEEPVEQTTTIKVETISTGLHACFQKGISNKLEADESLPMIGEEAHMLTENFTNQIVNQGLVESHIPVITPGTLVLSPNIKVYISIEDLLRTHFGVFGFTGSGKSNLMSTLISCLLTQDKIKLKLFQFDLMSEYSGLLIDLIDSFEDSYIVVFGEDSLPGGEVTREYLYGNESKLVDAAETISRTILLPKELASDALREKYKSKFMNILKNKKIKVYFEGADLTVGRLRDALNEVVSRGQTSNAKRAIISWIQASLAGEDDEDLSPERINSFIVEFNRYLEEDEIPEAFELRQSNGEGETGYTIIPSSRVTSLPQTARGIINDMISILRQFATPVEEMPEDMKITFEKILKISNDKRKSSLVLFQCNRDEELRIISSRIVNSIYNFRRRFGITTPTNLFVYDEADEFMPSSPPTSSTYAISLNCIRNLARRGRKFGMGLSISTQRVAYLDTSTLAQPHTYLISKLPRKYDREKMVDAFGITEDMMKKTLRFTKGQWLLVSYDATGLINVPIPIHFPNANDRIKQYLSP